MDMCRVFGSSERTAIPRFSTHLAANSIMTWPPTKLVEVEGGATPRCPSLYSASGFSGYGCLTSISPNWGGKGEIVAAIKLNRALLLIAALVFTSEKTQW
jgi:hypothetical protein